MTTFAFDVNGTLLDLAGLDAAFEAHLGDAGLRAPWFAQALQLAWVGQMTERPVAFADAQHAALELVAAGAGRPLTDAARSAIVDGMRRLAPHAGVRDGLLALRAAGHRLYALSNSGRDALRDQLAAAGLDGPFAGLVAAEEAAAVKPAAAPYRLLADRAGVPVAEVVLVAAHAWDVSGALAAGARAVLLARDGERPNPLGAQPERVVADLRELV